MRTALVGGAPYREPDLSQSFGAEKTSSYFSPPPPPKPKPACRVFFAWDDDAGPEFEWEAPVVRVGDLGPRAATAAPALEALSRAAPSNATHAPRVASPAPVLPADGPGNARIRERYCAVRFPGAPVLTAQADVSTIVKVARLYFEDGDSNRAVELLDCAAAMLPQEERLALAALEIRFLARQGERFVEAARAFRERFPDSPRWADIERLGWRFAPRERLFANGRPGDKSGDEHFGAWPESPNWIEAPWDLTSEVLAVELRGRVLGTVRPR